MIILRQFVAAGLLIAVLPATVYAGAWEIRPVVSASARYNDNPTLRPDGQPDLVPPIPDPQSVFSTIANVQADFAWLEPDATLVMTPQIKQTWYPDSDFSDLNSTDYFFRGSYNKTRPKWSWGLGVRYDYQSVLSSEDLDPGDPGGGDGSGNFLRVDDERERYSISPNLSWTPTRKDTFLFAVSGSRTDYQLDFTNRADIDSLSGTFSYERLFTPRQSLGFIATAYKSEAERRGGVLVCADGSLPFDCPGVIIVDGFFTNDADGQSFSLSYAYRWSETLRLSLSYGRQETDVESAIIGETNSFEDEDSFKSNQYSLSFQGDRERFDWDVTLSRRRTARIERVAGGQDSDRHRPDIPLYGKTERQPHCSWIRSGSAQRVCAA